MPITKKTTSDMEKTSSKKTPSKKGAKKLYLLRGMKDIVPEDQKYWEAVHDAVKDIALPYGYRRIETPIAESTALFVRTAGAGSDIVSKEMYSFEDKGGDKISLRPEGTAPVVRAYIEHGMLNQPTPVKLYYAGPMFRYDRPQSGRYRQFHQVGFECFNDADPVLDAQLILICLEIFKKLSIDASVHINSIGCEDCRPEYERRLQDYFKPFRKELSEEDQLRLKKTPLRVLDSKDPQTREFVKDAPQFIDFLCDTCRTHFVRVLEYLDEVGIKYELDSSIVRGLDYYNGTTFEFFTVGSEVSKQLALGGGGRYDHLVDELGGNDTPAVGVAIGVERIIQVMKTKEEEARAAGQELSIVPPIYKTDIFIAQLGIEARKIAMRLFEELRVGGISVSEALSKNSLKQQLEQADKQKAYFSLIIGQKEILDKTVLIRDMESGIQETADIKKVLKVIEKKLDTKKKGM